MQSSVVETRKKSDRVVRYVVVTPARNEEQYLGLTIQSMLSQTVQPLKWIVVDDGSTDKTPEIIDRAAAHYSWIDALHVSNRGSAVQHSQALSTGETKTSRGARAQMAKEIEAFYRGYEKLAVNDWDFVVKLDGDLSFAPEYFEQCFREFERDTKLGIAGGAICHPEPDGTLSTEKNPGFHVRGATKIYRRACWDGIGGVRRGAGWDTLDEVKANMLGWSTRTFEHLQVVHHRFTGSANGTWGNAVKNGVWSYIAGYHPIYILARSLRPLVERGSLVETGGLLYGYASGYFQGTSQAEDKQLIQYLRDQQIRRLLNRETMWK